MNIPDCVNPFIQAERLLRHPGRKNKHNGLSLIYKREKRDDVEAVLFNPAPSHYDRLWMVGFLFYAGYTSLQVCDLIYDLNEWDKYDEKTTYNQVMSIAKTFKGKKRHWRLEQLPE